MGIFSKLFNSEKQKEETHNEEENIKFFDENGNEMYVTKKVYKEKVLPEQFKTNWNNPDELYSVIIMSLRDGFIKEVLSPSKRLFQIDTNQERSYTLRAIVLLKNGFINKSKKILEEYCKKYGPTGVILTNLAKVYAEKDKQDKCIEILWKALKLDPNQDNGLMWWAAMHRDKGGKEEYIFALKEASNIKGSWRAQLYLAKEYFEDNEEKSLKIYDEVLKNDDLPSEALMEISGELGKNGFHKQIHELIVPRYKVYEDNPLIGLNILQSYLETNKKNEGIKLLNQLKSLKRPDLKQYFDFYYQKFNEIR